MCFLIGMLVLDSVGRQFWFCCYGVMGDVSSVQSVLGIVGVMICRLMLFGFVVFCVGIVVFVLYVFDEFLQVYQQMLFVLLLENGVIVCLLSIDVGFLLVNVMFVVLWVQMGVLQFR